MVAGVVWALPAQAAGAVLIGGGCVAVGYGLGRQASDGESVTEEPHVLADAGDAPRRLEVAGA